MQISYFDLPAEEQRDLLAIAEARTGRAPAVIEKDIWVCLVLHHLFSMPGRKAMAFKGGTSLSKVYSVIQRFSEDIDITIDYRELGCDLPVAELARQSRGQRDRLSEQLRGQVRAYTHEVVLPHLQSKLQKTECQITIDDDGEKLYVSYPSRTGDRDPYLRQHVLVEFGGRNIIDPNAVHVISSDVAELFPTVAFAQAEVVVLAAERTFWEKVTLIHDQCNRAFPAGRGRLSRHWYDLAMLVRHDTGRRALADLALLSDVIGLKEVFYRRATSQYERCLAGGLNLIPDAENLMLLERDYDEMHNAGMLNGHAYPLAEIIAELTTLQESINTLSRAQIPPIV
ncbi:MAG TPA: nucleotidyl transferase AbiEii/AbiGii toxin family protein [Pseudomonas sp.]|nr:nucleotidyl transferase AbiEii/AbiGii toxin family protein [Pseudomonas sp.]